MKNSFDEKILDEAKDWLTAKRNVVLATVIQTWGSSPRPIGSRMIINDKGDFSGSVSGGCVETAVVRDCLLYTSPSPRDVEESRMPSSA